MDVANLRGHGFKYLNTNSFTRCKFDSLNDSNRDELFQVPVAMEITNDGFKDGHCRMSGVIGDLFDIVIVEAKRLFPHFT